ncbi:MAG: hypothetical protein MAG794_00782 [Gammaproteobacteria bacterium]|nr:hypothetical protein [Gammaproteobacteria bacterium]
MQFLKRFVLFILVLVLALIGIGYLLPDSAHVQRSIRIEAPPEAVFPYVNNFRNFNECGLALQCLPRIAVGVTKIVGDLFVHDLTLVDIQTV